MARIALDTNEMEWRETQDPGLHWKVLRYEKDTGRSALLLRFEPGARAGRHVHPAGEEYFILEGSLTDGESTWGPGTYVCHSPASVHVPESEAGCVVLVWLDRPVEFV